MVTNRRTSKADRTRPRPNDFDTPVGTVEDSHLAWRLDELRIWANGSRMDLLVITETHWTQGYEWADRNRCYISHGSSTASHSGILIMINRRLCAPHDTAPTSILPGRLMHIRLYTAPRAVDVIATYQHSGTRTTDLLTARHTLWDALDRLLIRLPHRHMLLCLVLKL